MRALPRTAISLYVALALHALVLLAMALNTPAQHSAGPGQGLSIRGASLSAEQRRLVFGPPAATTIESPQARSASWPGADPVPTQVRRLTRDPGAMPTGTPTRMPGPGSNERANRSSAEGQLGGGGRDLYFALLRAHLAGFRQALRPGLPPARSHVRVAITRDGGVEDLVLIESSGLPDLDAEALDLVRRAAPLPAPPGGRAVRLIVPVEIVAP